MSDAKPAADAKRRAREAAAMYDEPARVMSERAIIRIERRELVAEIYEDYNEPSHPPIQAAFLALADVICEETSDRPSRFEFQYGATKYTVETKPL